MNPQYYPRPDETLYKSTLPNGLTVMVVPKPGFTRKTAYFVTDYGAVHTGFTLDGIHYDAPAGVAHFLEHKMFDLPGRDVSEEFAALGAAVNAFTSYDMTAYYFSATEHFGACLRLLLEFVSTPYFTEESVRKELGIIDQEIGMNLDDPGTQVFERLMLSLYNHHPIRVPILGSSESIRNITPEVLYTCHRAFYTPSNMMLCVIGDVDADEVEQIAREILGDEQRSAGIKDAPEEGPGKCPMDTVRGQMDIPMPTFSLAFKCPPLGKGDAAIRQEIIGDLAAEVLLGEASSLYLQLYEQGLIDSSFGGGFETIDGCAMLSCGGDSYESEAVRDALIARAAEIARQGVEEEEFRRLKRSAVGRRIRDLDSFSSTCFRLCAYHCSDFDYFRFPEVYETITGRDIQAFLDENVHKDNCSISIIYPSKEETL